MAITPSALTTDILSRSGGLLELAPEPSDARYKMFNTGSVEVETAEFLYGFVRLTKPGAILETGTHKGVSACYMGEALKDNGQAATLVETIEWEQQHVLDARQLIANLGLGGVVSVTQQDARKFTPHWNYDMLFLDSEPDMRFAELLRFVPNLNAGGYAFIHDLHAHMHQIDSEHGFGWPYGPIPDLLKDIVARGELRVIHFENPRGMTAFYKPHVGTYHW